MTQTLAALVLLIALAGCAGEVAQAEPKAALPTVSSATTCGQLFDGKAAPVTAVVDLMSADTTPSDDDRARDFADDLEGVGERAGEELAAHVEVVVSELREFADAVEGGDGFETDDMVTSLTELNNVCGVTPRF